MFFSNFSIKSLFLKIVAFFAAISLFYAAQANGTTPTDLEFDYELESEVTEFKAGDKVVVTSIVTNTGEPFLAPSPEEDYFWHMGNAYFYKETEDGNFYLGHDDYCFPDVIVPDVPIKTGTVYRNSFDYYVQDDAPKGSYTLRIRAGGLVKDFPNAITVV